MVKRTSFEEAACPVARSPDAIGDGWSLLIVRDAFDGLRRFGEFQKNLGMAKNILSDRLRTLTAHGILEAAPASDGSAYQEYVLTEKATRPVPRDRGPAAMGRGPLLRSAGSALGTDRPQRGQPVRRLEIHAQDGRRLEPDDTVVRKVAQG